MAIRLEFLQPYKGKQEMTVTPSVAANTRNLWVTKDYASEEQRKFIENVMKIHFSPEDIYCLHRYVLEKTIPMGKSKAYIMRCRQCDSSYPTDIYTQITDE